MDILEATKQEDLHIPKAFFGNWMKNSKNRLIIKLELLVSLLPHPILVPTKEAVRGIRKKKKCPYARFRSPR